MTDPFSFAAIVGYVGVVTNVLWPFIRGRTGMLLGQALGALCFASHYAMMEAWTASLLLTVAALQAFAAIPLGKSPRFRVIYLLTIPVIALILASSWHGWASLFASLGMATISLGRYQRDVIRFRALMVLCIPFWNVHNFIVWSIPGLISDVLSFSTGAWMLWVTVREMRAVAQELDPAGKSALRT